MFEKEIAEKIRAQGKQESTTKAYTYWVNRYIDWCKERKIGRETKAEVAAERFLSHLANYCNVSPKTQNQAFSALCYLYDDVLNRPLVGVSALRAKESQRIREVAEQSEIADIFTELKGKALLGARMMYGCSFRIGELAKLRMKDLYFERKQIIVHGSKGEKDKVVPFPDVLHEAVKRQVDSVRVLWQYDVAEGLNGVSLPKAWGRKSSSSHLDFSWYYLFAADDYSRCPHSGTMLRHHCHMGHIGRQIKDAVKRAGVNRRITSHCLRHSFATHALEGGTPVHVIQKIMGHSSIETTEGYLHVAKDGITSMKSPLESLLESPKIADTNRNDDKEPPTLRLFVG